MFGLKSSLVILFTLVFVVSGDIPTAKEGNSVTGSDDVASKLLNPENFPVDAILPNIDEGEEMLRKRCAKYGQNTSFDNAMEAREAFQTCVGNLIDVKVLMLEVEAAKPTGDLDTVFQKYCLKTPTFKDCLKNLTAGFGECFSEAEEPQVNLFHNVSDSLLNFVCHKEGDRIALFMAEGGPECFKSKAAQVQMCVNSTLSNAKKVNIENATTDEIPEMIFDEEKCGYFSQVQTCVVKVLEECKEPTPANIVGSLFEFVKKSTPCAKGSSNSLVFSVMSFLVPIGAIILSKL